jgi:hypothetical protein
MLGTLVYRSTVARAFVAGGLLFGCSTPDLPTDLRKDGPPSVTTVTVMSDLRTESDPNPPGLPRLLEAATFCRLNDVKRPGQVDLPDLTTTQECPDDLSQPSDTEGVAQGAPPTWFVRVVFDMLLDPKVEDLLDVLGPDNKPTGVKVGSLLATQPVTLRCDGIDIKYDGYYVPNGNRVSWPLGPALFIQPLSPVDVATGASCEVGVKDMVHNKRGQSVAGDRTFKFKIAPMRLRFSQPAQVDGKPGSVTLDPSTPLQYFWTAAIGAMPAGTEITISSGPNAADGSADPAVCSGASGAPVDAADIGVTHGDGEASTALIMSLILSPGGVDGWAPGTTYRVRFAPTAKVTAAQGGAPGTLPANYDLCFHTTAAQ